MKKVLVSMVLVLLVGCASTNDVEHIRGQIDELKSPINTIVLDSATAKANALEAVTSASFANYAAVKAEKEAEQFQFKLDRLVTKLKLFK